MTEEKIARRPQRKRIPVVAKYLAGSPLGLRGTLKRPQAPAKAEKIKPGPKIVLPSCSHGRTLTLLEFLRQKADKDKGHDIGYWFVGECPGCFPDCIHEFEALTPSEISSGKRWSAKCPGCNGPQIANTKTWDAFLKFWGLSDWRAASPAKYTIEMRNGRTVIAGQQKNYSTGRGSQQIEQIDASSRTARTDIKAKSTAPKGHDSGTYADEQVRVDDLGDPTSFTQSDFIGNAERLRIDATKEILSETEHTAESSVEEKKPESFDTTLNGLEPLKLSKSDKEIAREITKTFEDDGIPVGLGQT